MQAEDYEFEISSNLWSLYISEQQYGSLGYEGCGGWDRLQFRYILCVLMEYAGTLGLVDIAYIPPGGARHDYGDQWGADDMEYFSRYDGLFHLRVTGLGAYCLGNTDSYAPPVLPARRVLAITPDCQIQVMGPLSASDRLLLEILGIQQGEGVWLLNQEKTRSAMGQGREIREFIHFLESSSQSPLPEAVSKFFADAHYFANVLSDGGRARLIRCTDGALTALIASSSGAGKLCCQLGGDALVVKEKDMAAFGRAVQKLGFHVPLR